MPASASAGTVVDRIFLSYAAPLAADGSLSLEASLLSGPIAGGSALVVPEPESALLAATGLGLLAALRRRR